MVGLLSGFSCHDIDLGLLVGQGESWVYVCSDADYEHEYVRKRKGNLQNDQCDKRPYLGHIGGKKIDNSFLQIVIYLSAFLHSINNR